MQAKDREIALLRQQLGEKVSHELLVNSHSLTMIIVYRIYKF